MKILNNYAPAKAWTLCAAALLLITSSCRKDNDEIRDDLSPGPNVNVVALQQGNQLSYFNAQTGGTVSPTVGISGLQSGETILAVDYRPATGQLYGVSSGSRIYVIDQRTGAARAVSSTPFTPAINGTAVGFDFNPTVDRIRLITNNGQNLRLNPETGAVVNTDGALNGVSGVKISSAAYTENRAGASTTVLYDIDAATQKLYKQDPPNDGKLVEVGGLGISATEANDFDISPDGKVAIAPITANGQQGLYTIDLTSGKATKIANFTSRVLSVAIPTEPVAYAVSNNNELLIFNPNSPTPVVKAMTGLQTGENILGIDMRPVNGQLYALGSTSRLYTINASSGVATAVGTSPFTTLLVGTSFGFDFNPTVDRIRLVSNTGQNLRLNPETGAVAAIDGPLTTANSFINGAAYTNNFAGATSTVLYDINSSNGRLYRQDPPNDGTLVEVGSLGITVDAANGFDIGGTSNTAYGIFTVGGVTRIYSVNLQTGAATAGATFPQAVRGFALGLGF
ncbi:DUF4394 domain-containing protein [Mucilaginibacter daejeonensis]|uniref:DUF4394 domain-containing protein n=1 Tax=Mucilaginibacter daejeonensis TaxID=398049 RepID=UPI001D1705D2|nr:DUF4394 domain-containing protein [Mucilaginibacter daejeonensis]UEG52872.1 DUF4394 domain-containing protein [Mucilaginibacter daejeonensis]